MKGKAFIYRSCRVVRATIGIAGINKHPDGPHSKGSLSTAGKAEKRRADRRRKKGNDR